MICTSFCKEFVKSVLGLLGILICFPKYEEFFPVIDWCISVFLCMVSGVSIMIYYMINLQMVIIIPLER